MKKLITTTLLLLFVILSNYSQSSVNNLIKVATVAGKVIDDNLQQPLPYVNIIIKNANGDTLTGSITDENGEFKI